MNIPLCISFAQSFGAVYPLQADLWIDHFSARQQDRINVTLGLQPGRNGFLNLKIAEDGRTERLASPTLRFAFEPNDRPQVRRFQVVPVFEDGCGARVNIKIALYPSGFYAASGLMERPHAVIIHADPALHFSPPLDTRREDLILSEADSAFARKEWGSLLKGCVNDYEAACILSRAIAEALAGSNGVPSDQLMELPPLEQYRRMKAGASGYCENWAVVFTDACRAFGIVARTVWLSERLSKDHHIQAQYGSCHLTTEIFSRQLNQWIWIDNRFDCLGVYLGEEGPLNLAEFCLMLNQPHRRRRLQLEIQAPGDPHARRVDLESWNKKTMECFEEWGLALDYAQGAHRRLR